MFQTVSGSIAKRRLLYPFFGQWFDESPYYVLTWKKMNLQMRRVIKFTQKMAPCPPHWLSNKSFPFFYVIRELFTAVSRLLASPCCSSRPILVSAALAPSADRGTDLLWKALHSFFPSAAAARAVDQNLLQAFPNPDRKGGGLRRRKKGLAGRNTAGMILGTLVDSRN